MVIAPTHLGPSPVVATRFAISESKKAVSSGPMVIVMAPLMNQSLERAETMRSIYERPHGQIWSILGMYGVL